MKLFKIDWQIILLTMIFSVTFFTADKVLAQEYNVNEDSIYLYNALENTASIEEMLINPVAIENIEEQLNIQTTNKKLPMTEEEFQVTLQRITERQQSAIDKAEKIITSVNKRTEIRSIILGNNLGTLKFELVQIKGIQALLNSLLSKTFDVDTKLQIKEQIEALKEEQGKIELVLKTHKDQFSLFGWLVATL